MDNSIPPEVQRLHAGVKTSGKYTIAVKLDNGEVLFSERWGAHIDAAAALLDTPLADRIVDGGFVRNGKWESGGDLSQGLELGEKVPDYYGIRQAN